jgi:hypothetical protein
VCSCAAPSSPHLASDTATTLRLSHPFPRSDRVRSAAMVSSPDHRDVSVFAPLVGVSALAPLHVRRLGRTRMGQGSAGD